MGLTRNALLPFVACGHHEQTHMDLITNEVNSASFGATLLAHLTASFEQTILGTPIPIAEGDGPRIVQSPDNRFLYYAAHDINLLYVRNLLRCVRLFVFLLLNVALTVGKLDRKQRIVQIVTD